MALLCGRAGRLTAQNGGFRPGQCASATKFDYTPEGKIRATGTTSCVSVPDANLKPNRDQASPGTEREDVAMGPCADTRRALRLGLRLYFTPFCATVRGYFIHRICEDIRRLCF